MPGTVHLTRGPERDEAIEELVRVCGGRVGLAGVLDDLNRTARPAYAPGTAVEWAFRWDRQDSLSRRWWPQGITTSADAGACAVPAGETYAGRAVVLTTSYSKNLDGLAKGCRISVVDVTDPEQVRYRHVLLVEATLDEDGRVDLRPVRAHAGGAVWSGRHLHVAATAKGLHTFDLADVVRVEVTGRPDLLGVQREGSVAGFGHRYVLPLRWTHVAGAAGATALRYSFVSLTHGASPELLAGEYGRGDMTTRLVRFPLDGAGLPVTDDVGVLTPELLGVGGVQQMQGAVLVDGRLHVTTSNGRFRRGSLWTGGTELRRHPRTLPVGPEDVTWWPSTDRLWSLTEYPGSRMVFTVDRSRFG